MSRVIKVGVTQEDIDAALKSNSAKCVVAQAIARTLPDAHRISVDVQTVRFTDKRGVRRVYLTPAGVERYVIAFDAGATIRPFEFGLYDSQRVNVPTKKATDEGKARQRARVNERAAKERLAKVEADPGVSEAKRAVAAETLARRSSERVQIMSATDSQPEYEPARIPETDPGIIEAKRAPRRQVFAGATTNQRNYGHRAMRINQPDDKPGDFRGPLDIEE